MFGKLFSTCLPYILSGISVGGQYALIAIGYTMVYGILRLINFAHGDIFMVAGLIMVYSNVSITPLFMNMGFSAESAFIFSIIASVVIVLVLTVLLGLTIEKAAYRPLRSAPRMSVMISAIGVSYLIQNAAIYITGGLAKPYPTKGAAMPWLSDQITVGSSSIKRVTVITPILTILLVLALVLLIKKTKIGMAMRAVSKDFRTSRLMGIEVNNVISVTFFIGSFLAAVGSLLYFTNYASVTPTSGAMPGLKAFVAAVFGGIGSVPGAVVGAFIIGICENILKGLDNILSTAGVFKDGFTFGFATFSDAFTFILLIVILCVKPTGLFGEKNTDKV